MANFPKNRLLRQSANIQTVPVAVTAVSGK
jgi:hypothetical protein